MPNPFIKATNLFAYQNNTLQERTLIATASDATGANSLTNNVLYWDGSSNGISIFTPSLNASAVRAVNSRDWEFFADGIAADLKSWNINNGASNWGIVAPNAAPSVGAASGTTATWVANTIFSTMGILVDANNNVEQLVSVNASGTNATGTLGTTSVGQPTWNQTPGGTTTDGTITWTNRGPIGLWQATHSYTNYAVGGTAGAPAIVFDPISNALYVTTNTASSGTVRPPFTASTGWFYIESTGLKWFYIGTPSRGQQWLPSTFYPKQGSVLNNESASAVIEPITVTQAYSTLTNSFTNTVFVQSVTTAGTSAASYAAPDFQSTVGTYTYDKDLIWLNLGTANWQSNTVVVQWVPGSTNFTAIKDTNGNIQVCIVGGTTNPGVHPTWATTYGAQTTDGANVIWTCVGTSLSWAASTQWFLPSTGFVAPQTAASKGGASIVDSNGNLETVINSGKSGGSAPAWAAVNNTTVDNTVTWFDLIAIGTTTGVVTLITPVGRRYYVVYLNSIKQNFSDLSPVSAGTGPITNGQVSIFNIPISSDTQVDQKVILATADGGSPTILYFVGQIPNATTSFVDNITSTNLVLNNIYQQVDAAGNDIGVVGNEPPPNGSFPTLHKGRIFMIFNNALVFSKSLPEVTTSTGIIAGRFEEDWPPENVIQYTPGIEIGKGLLSDGTTLYIGTEQHIRRVLGDGDSLVSFGTPETIFSETGLMTQNVWKIVFLEGTPVGAMWVTPDFRVIESDFNTYKDVGTPIQSTLNTINPAATQTCWAQSVTYGPYNFYVLAIATGGNTAPDTMCVFDMHLHKWYIWQFADNFLSGLFYVSLSGVPRWVMVDTNGNMRFVDTTVVVDRSTDTPVPITSTLRTTWLHLGDASMRKTLNEIELDTSIISTLVTIEGATNTSDFTTPNVIATNLPLTPNIFGQLKVFLSGLPIIYRFYRFTFTSVSSASTSLVSDVLLGYFSAEILPLNRI